MVAEATLGQTGAALTCAGIETPARKEIGNESPGFARGRVSRRVCNADRWSVFRRSLEYG